MPLYLIKQPAFGNYRAFLGDITRPDSLTLTDIGREWSWPSVEYVRELGFKVTRVRKGVWKVE